MTEIRITGPAVSILIAGLMVLIAAMLFCAVRFIPVEKKPHVAIEQADIRVIFNGDGEYEVVADVEAEE